MSQRSDSRDGEDIAEQVAHQIDRRAGEQRRGDDAEGQRAMVGQAQNGVERHEFLAPQDDEKCGHRQRGDDDADRDIDVEQQAEGDTDEARLGDRLAEVGHAVPNEHRAERGCNNRKADAGRERAQKKRLDHSVSAGGAPVGTGSSRPSRPWAWS